jgi:hypothetical protein
MSKEYFATEDTETAAKFLMRFISDKTTTMNNSGTALFHMWDKNISMYYQNALSDSLSYGGSQGEVAQLSVPQARSFVRQTISLVCKQKLKFKSITRSKDYQAYAVSKIVDAKSSELTRNQNLDSQLERFTETCYLYGSSFWHVSWNSEGGKLLNGTPTGDVNISYLTPRDVFYDWTIKNWKDLNYCVVREKVSRYDLMAKHPELKDEIEKLPKAESNYDNSLNNSLEYTNTKENSDNVYLYTFYHKPSPSLISGRMIILASEKVVIYDSENPYECIPVVPAIPERLDDYLLGYPLFSNLTGLQEMLDHNFSVVASNQSAFGLQTVLNPRGSNINVTQLSGIQWVDYTPQGADGGGKPEPLALAKTAPEIIDMIPVYRNHMAELSNINNALRGQPPEGVTAGNALATLTANSLEFFNSLSKSVFNSVEEMMTLAIKCFWMFGAESQVVEVADGNLTYAKEFKAEELKDFDRVFIELANPLMNTYSFRLQSASELLNRGIIKDVSEYFRVLAGAPEDVLYENQLDELMLIQKENDDLMKGLQCPVLISDNHPLHKQHHYSLLYDPEVRRNGQMLQLILDHIQQHEMFEMQMMMPVAGQEQPSNSNPTETQIPEAQPKPQPAAPASPAKPKIQI